MLREQTTARFLVSSRARPRWANARLELYGDVLEIDRDTLAMDQTESVEVVGRRGDPAVAPFLALAQRMAGGARTGRRSPRTAPPDERCGAGGASPVSRGGALPAR